MLLWTSLFHTLRPMHTLPQLMIVCAEEQFDTSYYHAGKDRNETACLFKYTLEGEGAFSFQGKEYRVPRGHGFLCQICDPRITYYYPSGATSAWKFVWVQFHGPGVAETVLEMTERFGSIYTIPSTHSVIQEILGYQRFDGTNPAISSTEGAGLITNLLLTLAGQQERRHWDAPANVLVRRVWEVVSQTLDENLNASELADRLSVSREHLTRVFKEHTGTTLYQYIQRQKMVYAAQLLKQTTFSIKEIAARLSFRTPGHFTRSFKSIVSVTPQEYRQKETTPFL